MQIQAQIQFKAEVHVYSDNLTDQQITEALFTPCRSIEGTVAELIEKHGPGARVCAIPEGPMTIPYLRQPTTETGR